MTLKDKALTWSGNSCWGSGAVCDAECTSGNKAICVVSDPSTLIDTTTLLPMLREVKVAQGVDPLGIVAAADASPPGSMAYHDTYWWQVLRQPAPAKYGCSTCLQALNLMCEVVGALGWATAELGPFINAGLAPIRMIGEKVFGESYQKDAVQQFDNSQAAFLDALTETNLRTVIANQTSVATTANDSIKTFYSIDFDAPAEGTTATALKTLTSQGSPVGVAALFAAQHKLSSLDSDGHVAPAGSAKPPPARVYAAGNWLYSVNTYLQLLKATAVLQVFPQECAGRQVSDLCRTTYSNKTLADLFRESWGKDSYYLGRIVTDIANSDSGFIVQAQRLRGDILKGISERMKMMKSGSGNHSSCEGWVPAGGFPAPTTRSYSGNYVVDTGVKADFQLGSVVDPERMKVRSSNFSCSSRTIHIDSLVAIDPLEDLSYSGRPQNSRSAQQDGRKWVYFVAQRYYNIYNYPMVKTLDTHIAAWQKLVSEVCAIIPVKDGQPESIYCKKGV